MCSIIAFLYRSLLCGRVNVSTKEMTFTPSVFSNILFDFYPLHYKKKLIKFINQIIKFDRPNLGYLSGSN